MDPLVEPVQGLYRSRRISHIPAAVPSGYYPSTTAGNRRSLKPPSLVIEAAVPVFSPYPFYLCHKHRGWLFFTEVSLKTGNPMPFEKIKKKGTNVGLGTGSKGIGRPVKNGQNLSESVWMESF